MLPHVDQSRDTLDPDKTIWFDGNYSEYETDRKNRLGAAASQPHRIKYRQLIRAIFRLLDDPKNTIQKDLDISKKQTYVPIQ